jgi:hypothetical protein
MQLAQRLGCRGGVGRRTVHSAATELCWPRAPLNNSSAVRQLQHTTACRAVAAQQPPAPRLDLQDLSCPVPAQQQQQSAQELPAEIKAVLFRWEGRRRRVRLRSTPVRDPPSAVSRQPRGTS